MQNEELSRTFNQVARSGGNGAARKGVTLEASELLMYAAPLAALPAAGVGIAGLAGAGPAFLRRHPVVSALLACGGMAVLAKTQFDRFLLEQPEYEVIGASEGFELRCYPARVVAETTVQTSSFDEARKEGFKRLAAYLFGENEPGEKLDMTTPVTVARSTTEYVMRFQMPKARPIDELPRPKDVRVTLRRVPSEIVATLRFRGSYDGWRIAEKQRELFARVRAAGLEPAGDPAFAGYDSPATLPLLRRVEVWIPVADPEASRTSRV